VGQDVIVTVVGKNRPGVLSEVTGAIAKARANILDIHQKVIQKYFNLIMIVDLSSSQEAFQSFKARLEELGGRKGYRVHVQHEKIFQGMHRL
jgi:ACT domain-containing protein